MALERVAAADQVFRLSHADRVLWTLPLAYHFAVTITASGPGFVKVDGVYTADPKKDPTATRYAKVLNEMGSKYDFDPLLARVQ